MKSNTPPRLVLDSIGHHILTYGNKLVLYRKLNNLFCKQIAFKCSRRFSRGHQPKVVPIHQYNAGSCDHNPIVFGLKVQQSVVATSGGTTLGQRGQRGRACTVRWAGSGLRRPYHLLFSLIFSGFSFLKIHILQFTTKSQTLEPRLMICLKPELN